MGKLLLAHLQRATCVEDPEDSRPKDFKPTVKNTFIHIPLGERSPRDAALPRCRTAPSPQAAAVKEKQPQADKDSSISDDSDNNNLTSEEGPITSSALKQPVAVQPESCPTASWLVDGRRLKGRDTRISSLLRPLLGDGPDCAELVVSIFPVPVSAKRGGACFKAANGVGRIQLKCNNPIDEEMSVCISIGNKENRCQRHNFASNPLMTFHGDWDFKTFMDPNADRPTVTVNLQLLSSQQAENAPSHAAVWNGSITVAPAIADPAIAAFSLSTTSDIKPLAELPGAQEAPFHLAPSSSPSSHQTPDGTPRTMMQPGWQLLTPQVPSPQVPPAGVLPTPQSPHFNIGGTTLFCFTIRRADGVELGLEVNPDKTNQELIVERVIPGGAAEAWNRQCFQGPFSSKAVVPGDRIVGINGRCDYTGMLEECRQNQLLKLFIVRGDLPHSEIPVGWCGPGMPTVQVVAVPVPVFLVPCAKHAAMEFDGTPMFTCPDQPGQNAGNFYAEAAAPVVFGDFPPEPGQNSDSAAAESKDITYQ